MLLFVFQIHIGLWNSQLNRYRNRFNNFMSVTGLDKLQYWYNIYMANTENIFWVTQQLPWHVLYIDNMEILLVLNTFQFYGLTHGVSIPGVLFRRTSLEPFCASRQADVTGPAAATKYAAFRSNSHITLYSLCNYNVLYIFVFSIKFPLKQYVFEFWKPINKAFAWLQNN